MKAKRFIRESDDYKQALKELHKEDDIRGVYVRVPVSSFKKLKDELFKRRISMSKWVNEKIEEI